MSEIFTKFFLKVFMSIILLTMPTTYNIYDPAADFVEFDSTNMSFGRYSKSLKPRRPVTRNMQPNRPNQPYRSKAEKKAAKRKRRQAARAAKGNPVNSSAPNRSPKSVAESLTLPFGNKDQKRNKHDFGKMLKHIRGLAIRDETISKKFSAMHWPHEAQAPNDMPKGHKEYMHYVSEVKKASENLTNALNPLIKNAYNAQKKHDSKARQFNLYQIGSKQKLGRKQIEREVTAELFDRRVFVFVLKKIYVKINAENQKMYKESLTMPTGKFQSPIPQYMKALDKYIVARKKSDAALIASLKKVHVNVPELSIGSEFLDWSSIDIGSHISSNTYDVDIDMD